MIRHDLMDYGRTGMRSFFRDMAFILGTLGLIFVLMALDSAPVRSEALVYRTINVTPDMSVSSNSSADFVLPIPGGADYIAIKNDCTNTLYFNLSPTTKDATDYGLRLDAAQSFSGPFKVYTVSASNSSSAACTFTMQPAVISR